MSRQFGKRHTFRLSTKRTEQDENYELEMSESSGTLNIKFTKPRIFGSQEMATGYHCCMKRKNVKENERKILNRWIFFKCAICVMVVPIVNTAPKNGQKNLFQKYVKSTALISATNRKLHWFGQAGVFFFFFLE